MTQPLFIFQEGSEHTTVSCITVESKEQGRGDDTMSSEMTESLNRGSEHTTDSYFTVDENKKQDSDGIVKERRGAGLDRSRSMIIALQSPAGNKSRRGNLTFSNSIRQLSRAGTSRRHLVTDESEEAFFSNSVRQLSRAGTSRRHLVSVHNKVPIIPPF